MAWILIASMFLLSFSLVLNSIRVAILDERLDLRESKLIKNLTATRRRQACAKGNLQRKARSGGNSGNLRFPPVADMGSFTAT